MSDIAKDIASLSSKRLELVKRLLEQEGLDISQLPILPQKRESNSCPLSFSQQRLWFLDQLAPGNSAYNLYAAVHMAGLLNLAALEQCLGEVQQRHQVLRTTLAKVGGQPVQVIAPTASVVLAVEDLSHLPPAEREAKARQLISAESRHSFDLEKGPLWRVKLARLAQEEHILCITMHHSITDRWSMGIFIREMTALYAAFAAGQPSPLSPLPIQYADYAVWQRQWLAGKTMETHLAYWKQQLAGVAALEFPTDHPRPLVQTFQGAHQPLQLSHALTEALKALGLQEGCTLFMVLLAAFQVLLQRYTGQNDIAVGVPIANRNRPELESLIGFFVNTLVLRTDLAGDPTFRKLLGVVRGVATAAYAHQDLPFEKLVENLQPERDLSRNPLFQVMFAFQSAPLPELELVGLTLRLLQPDGETAQFDMTLSLVETAQGLSGSLEYNTDLFDAASLAKLPGHFQTLLESIVADPDQRLSDLSLLGEAERQQLLAAWNNTQKDYLDGLCIHQLFEAQAERTPDAIAVVFPSDKPGGQDTLLTYGELNRRANQVAQHLQALGVGPETLVGLCVERSPKMLVGLLGSLKAGGGCLPLDPAYPQERLALILEDARARVVLTQTVWAARFPPESVRVVCLDGDEKGLAQESETNPSLAISAENVAYVIYTSGSTGKPKGVCVSHGVAVNHFTAMQAAFGLNSTDRVLEFASLSFDVSLEQILPTLFSGAALVLRGDEVWGAADFLRKIQELNLTIFNVTPAYWQQLIQAPQINSGWGASQQLRLVIIGGEAILPETVRLWQQTPLSSVRLLNAYGPTEAVITASIFEIPPGFGRDSLASRVPIGRPLAHRAMYVLDPKGNPVPAGVWGELHIGGPLLARGYLNRSDLTAEHFVPNPFASLSPPPQAGGEPKGGTRLYKTGDLARYRPDGNIEFGGRADQQVKVRGYRIELGEIEAALGQHPAVREAVVTARDDLAASEPGQAGKRLAAYVVSTQAPPPSASELRNFLREKLPGYLVPSAFVMLEALPLTPSGKVDRQALPLPTGIHLDREEWAAPRTWVEETLAGIWARVLGIERVGIHDNFFELGGDSILSIQIISRASQAGIHLSPKQIFQYQTIAALAEVAEIAHGGQAEQGSVTGPVALTPIQQWFFEQDLDCHHWNQAVLLQTRGTLSPVALERTVSHLLAHHDALRLRFIRKEQGWQQFNADYDPREAAPFMWLSLSELSETKHPAAIQTIAAELQASLDLAQGPLLRVAFLDLGAGRPGRLLMVIHHLVVDGVTWRILLEDFETVYQQLARGEAAHLPPKTTSFQHWAQRLTEYAQSQELEAEAAYWLAEPRRQAVRLPVDYAEGPGANTEASARTVSVSLTEQETQALLHQVPAVYRTQINDVLLTALVQACGRWTQARSLLIDLEGHGREQVVEDVDLSRTAGWFTSVFPVLLELEEAGEPGQALKKIKEQLRQIPQRGIGYGLLRYLRQDAEIANQLRALPQAEVGFNYLGQFDQTMLEESEFGLATEPCGPLRGLRGRRSHLLDVNGSVAGGRLQVDWTCSDNLHRPFTLQSLAEEFIKSLRALIAHCLSPEAGGYTPSDFPLAQLDQQQLDRVAAGNQPLEDIYPLSPTQQGMHFYSLYAPESGVYIQQMSFAVHGPLNLHAFEQAWQCLVNRHPILRTAFFWQELDEPLQIVYQKASLPFEQHDWRGWSLFEQEKQLELFLQADRTQGFELSRAPLMRLILIRKAEDVHQCIWSLHHLISDGWSTPLLLKEFLLFYKAFCKNQALDLERPRPYRDYIAWVRQQKLSEAEAFWRQALRGFTTPVPLQLGQACENLPDQQARHREQELRLSAAVTGALHSLARQHQLTLSTFVYGTWALLLSHYSGAADVVFGITTSGRPTTMAGVESMVGLFINTLPLRVQVTPKSLCLAWLQELQGQVVELKQYEYSPLVQVQGWSEAPRGAPLFETIAVFANQPGGFSMQAEEQDPGLEIREVHGIEQTNYPLTLTAVPGDELLLQINYNCQRFDAAAVTRILGHLEKVYDYIIARPDASLGEVKQALAEADRQQQVIEQQERREANRQKLQRTRRKAVSE